jgi:GNAT superfamily N-acetyltransferase
MWASYQGFAELLSISAGNSPHHEGACRALNRTDWEQLCGLVLDHGLAIALADETQRQGIPPDLGGTLLETARLHRLRTEVMLLDLAPVLSALESAGASPVVLKGAALAQTFRLPRAFGDLDVLVPAEAVPTAVETLATLGFEEADTKRSRVFYERHHFHRVFRSRSGITLELHWALSRPSDYFRLDAGGLRERATIIAFQGGEMRVPHPADQLLHAAAQGLREGFAEARRILDAAILLRSGAATDPTLVARARASNLLAALWILLRLTEQLCGSPKAVAVDLEPPPWQRRSLELLDLPLVTVERQALGVHGMKIWMFAICAPSRGAVLKTLWSTAFPGERGLLDDGHPPDALPGLPYRIGVGLRRMMLIGAVAGSMGWRMLDRTGGRNGRRA